MASNFKLTAKARTLSLKDVYGMGEDNAYALFRKLRWPATEGAPVCPKCGHGEAYEIKSRRRFECKDCRRQFSVTSGTIFASRKLSFTDLLAAIAMVSNCAKGMSAVQLSRDLDVQVKTAFVLSHKIREAMASETANQMLGGIVEVDGCYVGGHVREANLREDRVDRRLARNRSPRRRVVVAIRERKGRTRTFITRHEHQGIAHILKVVSRDSTVHADEAAHWDALHAIFPTHRINHSEAYALGDICTNQAESYFSRLRRMIEGQHHHVSPHYLAAYANHAAFLEDHRIMDNGALAKRTISLAMAHPVSRQWKGYWQRSTQ